MSFNELTKRGDIASFKLTDRGLFWLKVSIVSTWGQDKLLFNEMLDYFDKNIEYWMTNLESYQEADEPLLFKEHIVDYIDYLDDKPISNFAHVDCSNQALQLYGVLTGCLATSSVANLSGRNDIRIDAYQLLADKLNEFIGEKVITRSIAKKPLMTTLYGKQKAYDSILDELSKLGYEVDAEEFGIIFEKAMMAIAPNAMTTMAKLQALNSENIGTYYWTLPDGFRVKYDVTSEVELNASFTSKKGQQVKIEASKIMYAPSKYNAGMAPNVIHSVDGYIARRVAILCPFEIATIHDDYGCHYNNVDHLIKVYKVILKQILKSNLLHNIMLEIADGRSFIAVKKVGTLTSEHIDKSLYALA